MVITIVREHMERAQSEQNMIHDQVAKQTQF